VGSEAPRATEPTAPPDRTVAVGSHAQYVPTLTAAAAWCVNTAVNKVAYSSDLDNFDLLTLKVVSESRVTWATSVPILVFLALSVFDLGPMYATDRRQTGRRQTASSLNAPPIRGGGIITSCAGGRNNMPPLLASWLLTFWPWKWCPSHVWRGLPLCQF